MRTNSAITTRTTAAHTASRNSVTPIDPLSIHFPLADIRADCTVAVIAIMKRRNAALRTTETVRASAIVLHTRRPVRVPILADTMTPNLDGVYTTQAPVLITRHHQTTNAISTGTQIYRAQFARSSREDITYTEVMTLDDTAMRAILMNSTAGTG